MKSLKRLGEILHECYEEVYKVTNPPADFNQLIESGEAKQDQFYNHYKLSETRQANILDRIFKKYKLSKMEKRKLSQEFYMGCSPMFE